MIAESIILHIDADEVIESWCREAKDAGDFLRMEEVGGLVPVNPHPSKVVTQKVVNLERNDRQ